MSTTEPRCALCGKPLAGHHYLRCERADLIAHWDDTHPAPTPPTPGRCTACNIASEGHPPTCRQSDMADAYALRQTIAGAYVATLRAQQTPRLSPDVPRIVFAEPVQGLNHADWHAREQMRESHRLQSVAAYASTTPLRDRRAVTSVDAAA